MDDSRVNAVTCTAWVPKGVAKQNPEKIEITKEELAKIIKETSENLVELEVEENEYTELEVEALEEDLKIKSKKGKNSQPNKGSNDIEMQDCEDKENDIDEESNNETDVNKREDDDFEKRYNFEEYDKETENLDSILKLGRLSVHADTSEDPYLTIKEDDDLSDVENNKIYPTDNLITVGHVDGDAVILEVYVYNDVEESLYVHHDILLPSVPLCMEWLNYDPEDEHLSPGNMVAIGSMSPVIEVWDLDLIDCLEPAYVLGRKPKKKKKISRIGHSDAVLCLGWNRELDHILASGSVDKTVILWDLQNCSEAQKFTKFADKVQDLKWHPKQSNHLLTGSSDKTVRLIDCLSEDNSKSWILDGEIESLVWNPCSSHSFNFFAATDTGSVYSIDSRHTKPLQKIDAHSKCCTGIVMNNKLPGCLITVSEDKTIKIWDVLNESNAKLIEEKRAEIGIIHTVSCSPESPFVLSLGGDDRANNFKVWDIRQSKNVRRGFSDRLNLPIDDENDDVDVDESQTVAKSEDEMEDLLQGPATSSSGKQPSKWKPSKKSKKKKGGHLDKKKRR